MRGIVLSFVAIVAIGCGDLWKEIHSGENGEQLYVMNRMTGDLYRVSDGEMIRVRRIRVDFETEARKRSASIRTWIIGDSMRINADIGYRDGRALVKGTIEPFIENLFSRGRDYYGVDWFLQLRLRDTQGFRIADIPISDSDLNEMVDGDTNAGWRITKSYPVDARVFANVGADASYVWKDWFDEKVRAFAETEHGKAAIAGLRASKRVNEEDSP